MLWINIGAGRSARGYPLETQTWLWALAGGCAALAGLASLADHRRARRRDPDRVGWVPWPLVLVIALLLAAAFAALALKS